MMVIRFGLIKLDNMLVSGNLHIDDFILDLLYQHLLILLSTYLLQRDNLAGEWKMR